MEKILKQVSSKSIKRSVRRKERLKKFLNYQDNKCFYCKKQLQLHEATRDHIFPASSGKTLVNNMLVCCKTCNMLKANYTPEEFKALLMHKIAHSKFGENTLPLPTETYKTILQSVNSLIKSNYNVYAGIA